MKKEKWVWMPHAGHFIAGHDCRFHLNTYVGKYIVSTVGEYLPDAPIREIFAQSRKVELTQKGDARLYEYLQKVGYEDIGYDRKFETMVFPAKRSTELQCCPWTMSSASNLDFLPYKTNVEAFEGHMKLCLKWSKK